MNKHSTHSETTKGVRSSQRRAAVCLGMLMPLFASASGPVVPGAGTLLQQMPPSSAGTPSAAQPPLSIQQTRSTALSDAESFLVNDIELRGNTLIATPALKELVRSAIGQPASLASLDELASRISRYYQTQGYPLTRAIVPPQTIENGLVVLLVIEARYDRISLNNRSRVVDSLVNDTMSQLQPGQFGAQGPLDRSLLLLSDLPGVTLDAALKPGDKPATSDLTVSIEPAPALTPYAFIDGYGSRYTGRARLGGGASLANPLHRGDAMSFAAMSSGGGLTYGRLAYDLPVSGQGTRLAAAFSDLRYELGDTAAPLQSHGSAQVASFWLRHPFWRSGRGNLYSQLQWDALNLRDRTDSSGLKIDRRLSSLTTTVQGDVQDFAVGSSTSHWNLSFSAGRTRFDDAAAQAADAATARTAGQWSKWTASLSHQQQLTAATALYMSMSVQAAGSNLDPSQKMSAGGPNSVRAYDVGALSGDSGSLLSAEWRYQLGEWANGRWLLIGFADAAHLRINKSPWVAGVNAATLSGAGLGINWTGPQRWAGSAYLASRIGAVPSQVSGSTAARLWVSGSKSF